MTFATYQDFLEFAKGLGVVISYPDKRSRSHLRRQIEDLQGTAPVPEPIKPEEAFVSVEWVSGGVTGGSCWGSSADIPVNADPEPEFECLDRILEAISPTISFIQYKRLRADCVEHDTKCQCGYYGNSTNYAVKRVKILTLYNALVEKQMINK
jgi:hypothetical protein